MRFWSLISLIAVLWGVPVGHAWAEPLSPGRYRPLGDPAIRPLHPAGPLPWHLVPDAELLAPPRAIEVRKPPTPGPLEPPPPQNEPQRAGRLYAGMGLGVYGIFGLSISFETGYFLTRRLILTAGFNAGAGLMGLSGAQTSRMAGAGTRWLLGDRLGGANFMLSSKLGYRQQSENSLDDEPPSNQVGFEIAFGTHLDLGKYYANIDWITLAGPLFKYNEEIPGSPHLNSGWELRPEPEEIRFFHVSAGFFL